MSVARVLLVDLPTYRAEAPAGVRDILLAGRMLRNMMIYVKTGVMPRDSVAFTRGLLTIASAVREEGAEPRYLRYRPGMDDELTATVRWADVVGVSSITPVQPQAERIYELVRQCNPGAVIVAGGYHPSAMAEDLLESCDVDAVVVGEGEMTMADIVRRGCVVDVPGTVTRSEDKGVIWGSVRERLSGDQFPTPAYDLLPGSIDQYDFNVSTMRGCTHQCAFCVNGKFWGRIRYAPVAHVMDELEYLSAHLRDGDVVHFTDNVFVADQERVEELCAEIVSRGLKLRFSCDLRPGSVTKSLLTTMVTAGFCEFAIGFEDADGDVLQQANKRASFDAAVQTAIAIQEVGGAAVTAYWMIGLPGTSRQSLAHNLLSIRELIDMGVVDVVSPRMFVPYPGTDMFSQPQQFGMDIVHRQWQEYDRVTTMPVLRLAGVSREEVRHYFWLLAATLNEAYRNRLDLDHDYLADAVARALAADQWAYC